MGYLTSLAINVGRGLLVLGLAAAFLGKRGRTIVWLVARRAWRRLAKRNEKAPPPPPPSPAYASDDEGAPSTTSCAQKVD